MAEMPQFQLFPPPSPKKKSGNNPFRKANKKQRDKTEPSSPIPLEELKNPARTEAVLVQIVEETNSVKPLPKAHVVDSRSATASPERRQQPRSIQTSGSPSRHNNSAESPASQTAKFSTASPVGSNRGTTEQRSLSSQPASASPKSPIVPIKSIFPRYDPNLPLSQQQYYPQNVGSSDLRRQAISRNQERLSLSPAPEIDNLLGPKTVPASVMNFPTDALDPVGVQYSSAEALESLWEAANGQRLPNTLGTFNLRMARIEPATFTFGDPQLPFYIMQTYSTNELAITRTHPRRPNKTIPVMMLSLEERSRRQAPNDGLVTVIFSRLAAMLAIDQARELSNQHSLAPTEAMEVEANAVKRAASQESCRLVWNGKQRRYELRHPSFAKQPTPALVGEDGIPLSPVQTRTPGTLHITVSTPSSNGQTPRQPPTILVTNPISSNAVEAANLAATPRTSTLPQTDIDEPLASLDLGTMTLSISAGLTAAAIPSLYAIDSLIAAILAVAVSDESTNPVLADMELYVPGQAPSRSSSRGPDSASTTPRSQGFKGKLVATLAEREDAEEEAKLMAQLRSSKSKSKSKDEEDKKGGFWSRSKSKKKKIVIDEIDLEKYGRYGYGSSREGEKMPGITRALLRIMFWALELTVRGLTLGVKALAWLLVNLTRCVTSEKF